MPRRLTEEEFIQRARTLHGDKYDYSHTKYTNSKALITVICPLHGEFQVKAGRHITIRTERGETSPQGCQKCWQESSRWTEKELAEVALQYKTRIEFQRQGKGAYLSALRKGILDDICSHMERQLKPHGYWTLERCKKEAKKYDARGKFMRGSASAYNVVLRNKWLEEVCAHMEKGADGYHYMVYGIINKRLNKAYVGVTKQHFNERMKMHKKGGSTRAAEIAQLKDTEFIELTNYTFLSNELKEAERSWGIEMSNRGYEVLNKSANYGSVGTSTRIHTDESIAAEAQKCKTRLEFKEKYPREYDAAVHHRILDKVCSHMRGIKPKNYWTKERCIEYAKTCENWDEFSSSKNGAYRAARNNGWTEEVKRESNLRMKNEMSWLRPGTRKEIWTKADHFYDIWIENDRCGMWRMRTLTGVNIDKLLKKFATGWIPAEDEDWKLWAKQNS